MAQLARLQQGIFKRSTRSVQFSLAAFGTFNIFGSIFVQVKEPFHLNY